MSYTISEITKKKSGWVPKVAKASTHDDSSMGKKQKGIAD